RAEDDVERAGREREGPREVVRHETDRAPAPPRRGQPGRRPVDAGQAALEALGGGAEELAPAAPEVEDVSTRQVAREPEDARDERRPEAATAGEPLERLAVRRHEAPGRQIEVLHSPALLDTMSGVGLEAPGGARAEPFEPEVPEQGPPAVLDVDVEERRLGPLEDAVVLRHLERVVPDPKPRGGPVAKRAVGVRRAPGRDPPLPPDVARPRADREHVRVPALAGVGE